MTTLPTAIHRCGDGCLDSYGEFVFDPSYLMLDRGR